MGKNYIAVDLGAESGRVMLGNVSNDKLELKEIRRFENGAVDQDGTLRWDFARLFCEIKKGIGEAIEAAGGKVEGLAVDSWGVDFGLLDAEGDLVEYPYCYRDSRTDGMLEKAFELMDKRAIYANSGVQFMQINTVYQLLSMKLNNSPALARARTLLFTADLISYLLCGRKYAEYTLASTSQLMNMETGQWSQEIFDGLGLPIELMPEVVTPGIRVGELSPEICSELNCEPVPVYAAGSHDTASAVAAVPASDENWAYLSSGTWSLLGVEVPEAIVTDDAFEMGFTNEGGVGGTIRFLKNIMGLWLLQECRRDWKEQGRELSYGELAEMAGNAEPFFGFLDVNYDEFLAPGDMPAKINRYLEKTGQKTTEDKGQMARLILDSLAMRYRREIQKVEKASGRAVEVLHVVGGGIKNELLCQLTADAIGKKVVTGPAEATASGNILVQAMGAGQIDSVETARRIVTNSFDLAEYLPRDTAIWNEKYAEFIQLQERDEDVS
ncbi:Rhamnulokinase [Anaerohalosphaera lusitana]|uniref:Rhamnulokinase n=1 Tax=Anaerohalosphaera lusitana TaxID=1936003 RepID=A0A1U9NMV6_9BACT|nr:rhamnulokinase family protein [Anaerohalosphaera lusitana]AQT69251.1 Rhamnulokinase [Anaerohalosphaera lusitana]